MAGTLPRRCSEVILVVRSFFPVVLALMLLPVYAQEQPELIRLELGDRVVLEYDARCPCPDGARIHSLTQLFRREHPEIAQVLVIYYLVPYEYMKEAAHIDDTGGILLGTSRTLSFGPAEFVFGQRDALPINVRRHEVWFWQIHDRVTLHELYHLYVTAVQPLLAANLSNEDLERHIEQMTLMFMASDPYKRWLSECPWLEGSSG